MGDVGDLTPPPYGLVDNAESLLPSRDLVFIDPVSTGYSRAVEGGKAKPFHGFQDLESVGELIRLWTTRNDRWMSPKFLAGESYGRSARRAWPSTCEHARHVPQRADADLQRARLRQPGLRHQRADRPLTSCPTYAAMAHYHGLLGGRR